MKIYSYITLFIMTLIIVIITLKILDYKVSKECESCYSKYSWCISFWKENNKCGN